MNRSITSGIRPVIALLDRFFRRPETLELLQKTSKPLVSNVSETSPYAVVPLPLETFGDSLPDQVGSIRVAAFYPNASTRIERHPNSTQFLFSLEGFGETQVLRNGKWESDTYGTSVEQVSLEASWHLVEQNVWHRSMGQGSIPWVLVAIHTATLVVDEYEK